MEAQNEATASTSGSTTEESQSNSELIKKLFSVLSDEEFLFSKKNLCKDHKTMSAQLNEIMAAMIKNFRDNTKKNIKLDYLTYEFQEREERLVRICGRLGLNEQQSAAVLKEVLYEMVGENLFEPVEKSKETPIEEQLKLHEYMKKIVEIKKCFLNIICCQMRIGVLKLSLRFASRTEGVKVPNTRTSRTHVHLEMETKRRKIKKNVNDLLQLLGEPTTSQTFGSESNAKGKNVGKK